MQTDIDPRNLIGRKAFDRNGTKIGTVDEVYLDDATGEPEWAAVRTGLFSRDAFVPLEPSELVGRRPARPLRTVPDQGRPGLRRRPPPLARAGTPALPPLRPGRAVAARRTGPRRRRRTAGLRRASARRRRPAARHRDGLDPGRPRGPRRQAACPRHRRRRVRAPSGSGSAGSSSGSSTGTCAPGRARDPGASNRTVTRPTPLPCTQPVPVLGVPDVVARQPAPLRRRPGSPGGAPGRRLRRSVRGLGGSASASRRVRAAWANRSSCV